MSDLEQRTWNRFKEMHKLTQSELSDDDSCNELRCTLSYVSMRFSIAMSDCRSAIINAFNLHNVSK